MVFLGAAFAWVIRKVLAGIDYGISVGAAMVAIAFAAGFTNSNASQPYWATVVLYLSAGLIAYFIVMAARRREIRSTLERGIESTLGLSLGPADSPIPEHTSAGERPSPKRSSVAWARGFFRIWVLLAIVWAVFVSAVSWNTLFNPFVSPMAGYSQGHSQHAVVQYLRRALQRVVRGRAERRVDTDPTRRRIRTFHAGRRARAQP